MVSKLKGKLFRCDGVPMAFSVHLCDDREDLKEVIEGLGGLVDDDEDEEGPFTITLVNGVEPVDTDREIFSSDFILKCCVKNVILSLQRFWLKKSETWSEEFDPTDVLLRDCTWAQARARFGLKAGLTGERNVKSKDLSILGEQVHPEVRLQRMDVNLLPCQSSAKPAYQLQNMKCDDDVSVLVNKIARRAKGQRNEFSQEERNAILNYVVENGCYSNLSGTMIWKEMEKHFPLHTWQSLKNHFMRRIMPSISQYDVHKDTVTKIRSALKGVQNQSGKISNYFKREILTESSEEDDNSSNDSMPKKRRKHVNVVKFGPKDDESSNSLYNLSDSVSSSDDTMSKTTSLTRKFRYSKRNQKNMPHSGTRSSPRKYNKIKLRYSRFDDNLSTDSARDDASDVPSNGDSKTLVVQMHLPSTSSGHNSAAQTSPMRSKSSPLSGDTKHENRKTSNYRSENENASTLDASQKISLMSQASENIFMFNEVDLTSDSTESNCADPVSCNSSIQKGNRNYELVQQASTSNHLIQSHKLSKDFCAQWDCDEPLTSEACVQTDAVNLKCHTSESEPVRVSVLTQTENISHNDYQTDFTKAANGSAIGIGDLYVEPPSPECAEIPMSSTPLRVNTSTRRSLRLSPVKQKCSDELQQLKVNQKLNTDTVAVGRGEIIYTSPNSEDNTSGEMVIVSELKRVRSSPRKLPVNTEELTTEKEEATGTKTTIPNANEVPSQTSFNNEWKDNQHKSCSYAGGESKTVLSSKMSNSSGKKTTTAQTFGISTRSKDELQKRKTRSKVVKLKL